MAHHGSTSNASRPASFETLLSNQPDKALPLVEVFGDAAQNLEAAVLAGADHRDQINRLETFLKTLQRERADCAEDILLATQITQWVAENREVTKVEQIAENFQIPKRLSARRLKGFRSLWVRSLNPAV